VKLIRHLLVALAAGSMLVGPKVAAQAVDPNDPCVKVFASYFNLAEANYSWGDPNDLGNFAATLWDRLQVLKGSLDKTDADLATIPADKRIPLLTTLDKYNDCMPKRVMVRHSASWSRWPARRGASMRSRSRTRSRPFAISSSSPAVAAERAQSLLGAVLHDAILH